MSSIAAFVAALCACGVTAIHAAVHEAIAVGICLRVDPSISSRHITDRLKTETEAIWRPYGIRIEWTDTSPEFAATSVSIDASLEREFGNPRRMLWPPVLGRAVVRPATPTWGAIRVSFDATEDLLALQRTSRTSIAGLVLDQELARALGRVLAHEIGHVLLGAPYHDRVGLMRAVFRPDELAERDRRPFRLTCDGVGRLGSRLRVLAPDAQWVRPHDSTLDVEGFRTRLAGSPGASCIALHTSR